LILNGLSQVSIQCKCELFFYSYSIIFVFITEFGLKFDKGWYPNLVNPAEYIRRCTTSRAVCHPCKLTDMVTMAHGLDRLIERAEMPTASATDGLERERALRSRACFASPCPLALPEQESQNCSASEARRELADANYKKSWRGTNQSLAFLPS
jgi:hypothetical protein